MASDQTTQTTKSDTSSDSSKKKPGRKKGWRKNPEHVQETVQAKTGGNPDFNLNDAEPLGLDVEALIKGEDVPRGTIDYTAMEKARFETKPVKAMSALTEEDLLFEAELQSLHVAQPVPQASKIELVKPEEIVSNFLGDLVKDYVEAKSINELESQVFKAKQLGADSIEASEDLIKYYCKGEMPTKQGYFHFKDIKVFIPGRATGHVSDKASVYAGIY